eukprot:TRINITY_DN542_c0_g1_i1.p1 TRINITY_DN542_c0_g1~~TRINITY_DN542_c0_g1_i1.p1  ORF type:complete len:1470 (+),score=659.45 TRINITY_DN542_c0_g1_i1:33-4442(+)
MKTGKDKEKDRQQKNLKKLNNFFDKTASLSKRFKSLISYIEKASNEELSKFFNENFYMIFTVFSENFAAYENSCKKGKHSGGEVTDLLTVLRQIMTHLTELIRKRWQVRPFALVLEKVLYKENKASVRLAGFELLLLFLEALQAAEEPQTELLAAAVDLQPFMGSIYPSAQFKFQTLSAPDKTCVLVPGTQTGFETSVQMLEKLLGFMKSHEESFLFWWDLFKTKFFITFYPEKAKRLHLLDDDTGFKPNCPHQIQSVIIQFLEEWMKIPAIVNILWTNEDNINIILEIYRQSCCLPIQHCADTIRKSIFLFKKIFLDSPIQEVKHRLVEFRKFYIENISLIFQTETPAANLQMHVDLCREILNFIKALFVDSLETLEVETQEVFLNTLLDTTCYLLKENTPSAQLGKQLASVVLDTVIYAWIRTKTQQEHLWKRLQDGISSLFHDKQPVIETRAKIIQLTLIIREMIYPVREKKKKVIKVASTNGEEATPPPKKAEAKISKCPDVLPIPKPVERDPAIAKMTFTVDEIKYIWFQVLWIFSKVNQIADPGIHADAIDAVTEVVTILQQAEEAVPYQDIINPALPPLISLLNTFGPWLFECCAIPHDSHMEGKRLSYGCLCRLICRHHMHPLPHKLLAHFYGIIHRGLLASSNTPITWEILLYASNIFNLALPGANVLIPYFLRETQKVLQSSQAPIFAKMKAITVVCSLICYPNHLEGAAIPIEDTQITGPKELKSADMKKLILTILNDTLNNDPTAEHKVMCLWGLCVLIIEEVFNSPNQVFVQECLKPILANCMHNELAVVRAALDCLSCLSQLYGQIRTLESSITDTIIGILCDNICNMIKDSSGKLLRETITADHFYCLLDWIMAYTAQYVFDKATLATRVFEAIELGLLGQRAVQSVDTQSQKRGDDKKDRRKRVSVKPEKATGKEDDNSGGDLNRYNPSHASSIVCEAAEIILMHFINFLQNFPCKEGIDIHSSLVLEQDDLLEQDVTTNFYIYNDSVIFSVVQVPHPSGGVSARLIVRDQTGKYAWDMQATYDNPNSKGPDPPVSLFRESNVPETYIPPVDPEIAALKPYSRTTPQRPRYLADTDISQIDQLDELLEFLSGNMPDSLPDNGQRLNIPAPSLPDFVNKVQTTQKALLQQASADNKVVEHRIATRQAPEFWMIKPPECPIPQSPTHYCRMLLNQFGYLLFERRDTFCELENSQRFFRSLAQLDKTYGREMLKIGVIYVQQGQDDQRIILRNDTRTPLYKEFVRGLGWTIDIANHRGYLGGLDIKLTTGVTTPYTANSIMEIIFHDITSMPTNPSDDQQIIKKRHVGNDIVHIIYSEHVRDYSPDTITSQFNDAHIIVYPLPNGLYRLQVYRKENVPLFGPVIHGMCTNKKLLTFLVRQTAINANRAVRYNTEGYTRPYPTRRRSLAEIVQRYKITKKYEDEICEIIQPTPKPAELGASSSNLTSKPAASPVPAS